MTTIQCTHMHYFLQNMTVHMLTLIGIGSILGGIGALAWFIHKMCIDRRVENIRDELSASRAKARWAYIRNTERMP